MRASLHLLVACFVFATPAFAQSTSQGAPVSSTTKQFLDFASQVNLGEIRGGILAEQKAQAPAVKAYGRLMMLDHSELESQLDAIAAGSNVSLPNQPSAAAEAQMNELKSMSGPQFDTAYMKDMVNGHEKAVGKFRSEQLSADNTSVRTIASTALPILEQHLALAKAVRESLISHQNLASAREP
jgi:putative membrane protein